MMRLLEDIFAAIGWALLALCLINTALALLVCGIEGANALWDTSFTNKLSHNVASPIVNFYIGAIDTLARWVTDT